MKQQFTKAKDFIRSNAIPILLLAYFVRFAISQGSFLLFTLTGFFYSFTLWLVIGYLTIIGIIGIVGLGKSKTQNISINPQHKSFLFFFFIWFGAVWFFSD